MNVSRFFLSWQSFNHFAARAWFMGFARTSSLLAEIYFPKKKPDGDLFGLSILSNERRSTE
jgi:hypothetical protein